MRFEGSIPESMRWVMGRRHGSQQLPIPLGGLGTKTLGNVRNKRCHNQGTVRQISSGAALALLLMDAVVTICEIHAHGKHARSCKVFRGGKGIQVKQLPMCSFMCSFLLLSPVAVFPRQKRPNLCSNRIIGARQV